MILTVKTETVDNESFVTVTTGVRGIDGTSTPLDPNEPKMGWEWSTKTGQWFQYTWDPVNHWWDRLR